MAASQSEGGGIVQAAAGIWHDHGARGFFRGVRNETGVFFSLKCSHEKRLFTKTGSGQARQIFENLKIEGTEILSCTGWVPAYVRIGPLFVGMPALVEQVRKRCFGLSYIE